MKDLKTYLKNGTQVMGIINLTPDSFSDGGKYTNIDDALATIRAQLKNGVRIIDIGGESTRPGSNPVPAKLELERILPLLKKLKKLQDEYYKDNGEYFFISLDTRKAEVARVAIKEGVDIINDVSGFRFDEALIDVVASNNLYCVVTHSRGTPKNMQNYKKYGNLLEEVTSELSEQINLLKSRGVQGDKIIIDPGLGFGKGGEQNWEIIRNISKFERLGYPILVGASRKKFVKRYLETDKTFVGDLTIALYLASQGVDILRVHDGIEVSRGIRLWQQL